MRPCAKPIARSTIDSGFSSLRNNCRRVCRVAGHRKDVGPDCFNQKAVDARRGAILGARLYCAEPDKFSGRSLRRNAHCAEVDERDVQKELGSRKVEATANTQRRRNASVPSHWHPGFKTPSPPRRKIVKSKSASYLPLSASIEIAKQKHTARSLPLSQADFRILR